MMADRGMYPPGVEKVINAFLAEGRTVAMNPAIDKQRARFGLPPLSPVPMDEIGVLIGLSEGEGEET